MYPGKILRATPNSKGYMRVRLSGKERQKYWFVHRLVATHFLKNNFQNECNVVNHLDCNILNNNASNLEWTTTKENVEHSMNLGRYTRTHEWLEHLRETQELQGKPVIATHITTGKKLLFICLNDCRQSGFQPSCVSQCCRGIRKQHKQHTWEYVTPDDLERLKQLWGQKDT